MKTVPVRLSRAEVNHVYAVMSDAQNEGSYYGNRAQYWKRHCRVMAKLLETFQDDDAVARPFGGSTA